MPDLTQQLQSKLDKLESDLASLRNEHNDLQRRYDCLQGDGSGVTKEGDTLSFRLPSQGSEAKEDEAEGRPATISGVCADLDGLGPAGWTITFLIVKAVKE